MKDLKRTAAAVTALMLLISGPFSTIDPQLSIFNASVISGEVQDAVPLTAGKAEVNNADYVLEIAKTVKQYDSLKNVSQYSNAYSDGNISGGNLKPEYIGHEKNKVIEVPVNMLANAGVNTGTIKFDYDSELEFIGCLKDDGGNVVSIDAVVDYGIKTKKLLINNNHGKNCTKTGTLATMLFMLPDDVKMDHEYPINFIEDGFNFVAADPFENVVSGTDGYAMVTSSDPAEDADYVLDIDDVTKYYDSLKTVSQYTNAYSNGTIKPEYAGYEKNKVIEVPVNMLVNAGVNTATIKFDFDPDLKLLGCLTDENGNIQSIDAIMDCGIKTKKLLINNNHGKDCVKTGALATLLFILPEDVKMDYKYNVNFIKDGFNFVASIPSDNFAKGTDGYAMVTKEADITTTEVTTSATTTNPVTSETTLPGSGTAVTTSPTKTSSESSTNVTTKSTASTSAVTQSTTKSTSHMTVTTKATSVTSNTDVSKTTLPTSNTTVPTSDSTVTSVSKTTVSTIPTETTTTSGTTTEKPINKDAMKFVFKDAVVKAGQTNEISLMLENNTFGISSFQAGLVIGTGKEGFKASFMASDFDGTWTSSKLSNGVQFLSSDGHNIKTGDGEFAFIDLTVPADIANGVYDIYFTDLQASSLKDGEGQSIVDPSKLACVVGKLTVKDGIGEVTSTETTKPTESETTTVSETTIVSEPTSESTTAPVPGSETKPTSESVTRPTSESVTRPTSESVTRPTSESEKKPTSESVTRPTSESETKPTSESVTKPTSESETKPTSESVTRPTSESVTKPTSESVTEPTSESTTVPVSESVTKPTSESTTAPVSGSETKPTSESTTEPVTQPSETKPSETTVSDIEIPIVTSISNLKDDRVDSDDKIDVKTPVNIKCDDVSTVEGMKLPAIPVKLKDFNTDSYFHEAVLEFTMDDWFKISDIEINSAIKTADTTYEIIGNKVYLYGINTKGLSADSELFLLIVDAKENTPAGDYDIKINATLKRAVNYVVEDGVKKAVYKELSPVNGENSTITINSKSIVSKEIVSGSVKMTGPDMKFYYAHSDKQIDLTGFKVTVDIITTYDNGETTVEKGVDITSKVSLANNAVPSKLYNKTAFKYAIDVTYTDAEIAPDGMNVGSFDVLIGELGDITLNHDVDVVDSTIVLRESAKNIIGLSILNTVLDESKLQLESGLLESVGEKTLLDFMRFLGDPYIDEEGELDVVDSTLILRFSVISAVADVKGEKIDVAAEWGKLLAK